ncbi:hypothetical protein [Actinacidiphila sp. bgisy160]|uniref:hypothetical protein n=1 Tax=Actinacidiphila sp. bgisy160 TaxID=3413796 RepID=UPI003D751A2F
MNPTNPGSASNHQYVVPPQGAAVDRAPYSVFVSARGLAGHERRAADGAPAATVERTGEGGARGGVVADVHVMAGAGRAADGTWPGFALVGAGDGATVCTVHPVGPQAYEVRAGDGAPLGRLTRRAGGFLPPRRVRWTAEAVLGPTWTGAVGPRSAWAAYVLLSPAWFPLWLVLVAYSYVDALLDGGRADWAVRLTGPVRTRWRAAGGGGGLGFKGPRYRIEPDRIDHRLALAQAVLHASDR